MSTRIAGMAIGFALSASLAGCGGQDNSGFVVGTTNTPGSGTAYAFIPPVVNSSRLYAETIVDNAQNTINVGYSRTATAIDADGIITEQQQSTTGAGNTVNGTDYTPLSESQTYNSFGRETSYTYTETSGNPGSCVYTPFGGGPTPPLTVGQSWRTNYTLVCNGNPAVDYSQQGSVVDVESVTVPGGTFSALKLQSTTSWTDIHGTQHMQSTANWLDIATFLSVKQSSTFVDSGSAPANGYAISREIELQSIS